MNTHDLLDVATAAFARLFAARAPATSQAFASTSCHATLNDQHMFAIEIADTNVAIEALHTNQLLAAERHPHLADLFQYHSTEFERSVVEFQ